MRFNSYSSIQKFVVSKIFFMFLKDVFVIFTKAAFILLKIQ